MKAWFSKLQRGPALPIYLPMGESIFPHLKAGIPAPPLSGNPLLCSYQEHSLPKCTLRHIIIKILSTQNKEFWKAAQDKRQVTYKGKPPSITTDFSTQTLNTRRSWKEIIQTLKENKCQPRLVYPAKLRFVIEGEIKTFNNKEKLKECETTKPALQKILKGLLHVEEETSQY
jgi:hypothetical protein